MFLPPADPTPHTLHEFFHTFQPWETAFLSKLTLPHDNGLPIASTLISQKLKGGSDSSVRMTVAGFRYLLSGDNKENDMFGYNRCHDSENDPLSLLPEMEGLLAVLILITEISTVHKVKKG